MGHLFPYRFSFLWQPNLIRILFFRSLLYFRLRPPDRLPRGGPLLPLQNLRVWRHRLHGKAVGEGPNSPGVGKEAPAGGGVRRHIRIFGSI